MIAGVILGGRAAQRCSRRAGAIGRLARGLPLRNGGGRHRCWLRDASHGRRIVHLWWTRVTAGQVGVTLLRTLPPAGAHGRDDLRPGSAAVARGLGQRKFGLLEVGRRCPSKRVSAHGRRHHDLLRVHQ